MNAHQPRRPAGSSLGGQFENRPAGAEAPPGLIAGTPWQKGAQDVQHMLERGELDAVDPDTSLAFRTLELAWGDLNAAREIVSKYPATAFDNAYDAGRKAMVAVLSHQGLRAGSGEGGHWVIGETMRAQIDPAMGQQFQALRRIRNATEYPSADEPHATDADAHRAIEFAEKLLKAAPALIEQMGVFPADRTPRAPR